MGDTVELLKKTKTKKVESKDLIQDVAHELANLSKDQVEEMAHELDDMEGQNEFRLGAVFSAIQVNQYYGDFKDFKTYVKANYRTDYRKALYCINIYNKLVQEQITWDQVKDLGWTKLMILVPVITGENITEWVEKATPVNCETLKEMVKAALGGTEEGEEVKLTSEVTTLAFKVKPDQKEIIKAALDKAKSEATPPTEFDNVALDYICTAYLGDNLTVQTPVKTDLKGAMKSAGWEKTLEIFGELFPEIFLEVTPPVEA